MIKSYSTASLAFALTLCMSPGVAAQCGTAIEGDVTGQTWTVAGSPYCVLKRINVNSLTIQPGVTVRVSSNNFITIKGTISAVGTAAQPVIFTPMNPADPWRGLIFRGAPNGSRLSHCRFEPTEFGPPLSITDTTVAIDNCEFPNLTRGAIRARLATQDLTLTDCTFSNLRNTTSGGAIDAKLDAGNLTVSGCSFSNNASNGSGGAINMSMSGGTAAIQDSVFTNNSCFQFGGAIGGFVTGGQLLVTDCTFTGNAADAYNTAVPGTATGDSSGGAISISGNAVIKQCSFVSNRSRAHRLSQAAVGRGGALAILSGGAVLENCLFTGNIAQGSFTNTGGVGAAHALGGAIYMSFGPLKATNCLLSGNVTRVDGTTDTEEHGAGIYVAGFFPADLTNCTITGGTSVSGADGGVYLAGGTATMRNSIAYFNAGSDVSGPGTLSATYSNIGPAAGTSTYPGTGNINADPGFAAMPVGAEIIAAGSPCIDAGDPTAADNDVCFPPSLGVARNDMGAHGGPLACNWGSIARTGTGLALSMSGPVIRAPGTLTLTVVGGTPGNPAVFFITGVNNSPILVGLPTLLTISPAGIADLTLNVPPTPPGSTVDFQGFAINRVGLIEQSNSARVLLR